MSVAVDSARDLRSFSITVDPERAIRIACIACAEDVIEVNEDVSLDDILVASEQHIEICAP